MNMTYTHKESPMFSTKSWTDKIAPLYAWRKPTTDCIVHEDNLQQTYNGVVARLHDAPVTGSNTMQSTREEPQFKIASSL